MIKINIKNTSNEDKQNYINLLEEFADTYSSYYIKSDTLISINDSDEFVIAYENGVNEIYFEVADTEIDNFNCFNERMQIV